jgi:hypothetical protein
MLVQQLVHGKHVNLVLLEYRSKMIITFNVTFVIWDL